MKNKIDKTDLYIHPNISDFTVVSFAEGRELINAGVEGTKPFFQDLLKLAQRQIPKERKKIAFKSDTSLFIKEIEIEGNVNYSRAYVMGKLKLRTPAMTTYAEFNEGVNNLSATENFQNIDYQFHQDEEGQYTVHFNLIESTSTTALRLAVHYDDLFQTAALINVTKKNLITNNDVASFDFIIGDNLRYNLNYYIDKGFYWSIGFNSHYDYFDIDVPISFISPELNSEEGSSLNELDLRYGDLTNQIFVETLLKRSFLFRMGAEHKWLRYLTKTIGIDADNNPRTIFENTNYFSAYGFMKYDTFDNLYFPKKGLLLEGDFHYYLFASGLNSDFDQFAIAKAKASFAHTFFKKLSFILSCEGGFRIGGDSTRSLDFFLGGYGFKPINNIHSFYGYEPLSLRGNTYLKTDLTVNFEMFKNHYINASANIANIGDNLFETDQWIDGIDNSGYALGYGWDTFLGPVELKYSYSPETDEGIWYVAVGYRF